MIGDRGIEGDVAARMDAYRGNPNALMQRYSQSQQLIDLLALQKLKSEKEAAARQMQMQMAQQQASQGQPPTIKDQREQEVLGLTKQELAQQQSKTLMQKQQQQQANMQRLMQSGVAGLPAPNVARMAGGGIVAFAGEDGSTVGEETEEEKAKREEAEQRASDREAMLSTLRKLKAAGMDVGTLPGRALAGAFESVVTRPLRAAGVNVPYLPRDFYGGDASSMTPYMDRLRRDEAAAKVPPVSATYPDETSRGTAAGIAATPPAQAAAPAPAAPVPGTVARPVGVPAAAPALSKDTQGLGSLVNTTASNMMRIDPRKEQLAEEERIRKMRELTPEQRKAYEEGIANLRKVYAEEMDPEAIRERKLSAFLRGAGGRSSFGSVMGGASGSAEAERQRNLAQRLKGTEAIQKKLEDVIGMERKAVEEGIGAGQKTYEQRSLSQREGLSQGRAQYGTEVQSRDKALDREIEKSKVAVQAEANAALRDQTNFQRLQSTLGSVNKTVSDIEQKYMKLYMPQIDLLKMQLQAKNGKDPALEAQLRKAYDEMSTVIEGATADLRRQQKALEGALSKGMTGLSQSDQDLISRYTK